MPGHPTLLADLLDSGHVQLDLNLASKKSVLERAAELLARGDGHAGRREIFDGLCRRERLGSTALGHGVAIPHCRVEQSGVSAAFLRLARPVRFDSPDGQDVDLFFALAVPERCSEQHLRLLATIAELCSDDKVRGEMRSVADFGELKKVLQAAPTAGTSP